MTIKLGRNFFFVLILWALIWTQNTNMIAQKIAIENSYQQKISSAVSSLLGDEKFLTIVSVEFSTLGAIKKTAELQSSTNSQGTYIPGLPTVPSNSNNINQNNNELYKDNKKSDLNLSRIDVIIGMNEISITGSIKQEIRSLVETIIPIIKDCEDCFKIQAMEFQTGQKNKRLDELESQIEKLETAKRRADLAADSIRLANLEAQLTDANNAKNALETMAQRREIQRLEEDSIRFAQLIESERLRKIQDSIKFVNTEERLERVMESKIKSDSVIIREAMDIMKQNAIGTKSDESLLGMQMGNNSSNIMTYILIILLIVSLMVVTFLAANNKKPKTIYLKPKENNTNKKTDKKKSNKQEVESKSKNNSEEIKSDQEKNEEKPANPPQLKPDEDVARSEIKSLRQTAVSLSVAEKEGASALIKEWLDDNPNKDESAEEDSGEE